MGLCRLHDPRREDGAYIRPVSARYMHKKEVEHFVRQQQK